MVPSSLGDIFAGFKLTVGFALLRTRITPGTWAAVALATAGLAVISLQGFSVGYGEGTQYGPQYQDWQVRLYEGTNIIEFFYSNARGQIPTCLTNWGTRSLTTSS